MRCVVVSVTKTSFEVPHLRFALRAIARGEDLWLTDDGSGTDEALDFEPWGTGGSLVVFLDRDQAASAVEGAWRSWCRARGMTVAVVRVWEYSGGKYALSK